MHAEKARHKITNGRRLDPSAYGRTAADARLPGRRRPGAQRPKIEATAHRERLNSLLPAPGADRRPQTGRSCSCSRTCIGSTRGSESSIEVLVEALRHPDAAVGELPPGIRRAVDARRKLRASLAVAAAPRAADRLAHQLLGDDPSVATLLPLIADRARGNPLFIEELVRKLRRERAPRRRRAATTGCCAHPTCSSLPDNVQAIIGARIDSRPEPEKSILQTAAVIGREFAATVAGAPVAGFASGARQAALHRLSRAGFVYETGSKPRWRFAFRHPMVQDVIYRSLPSNAGGRCMPRSPRP